MLHKKFDVDVTVDLTTVDPALGWHAFAGSLVDMVMLRATHEPEYARFRCIDKSRYPLIEHILKCIDNGSARFERRMLSDSDKRDIPMLHAVRVYRTAKHLRIVWAGLILDGDIIAGEHV